MIKSSIIDNGSVDYAKSLKVTRASNPIPLSTHTVRAPPSLSAPTVGRVAKGRQQQRHVIMLPLVHLEHHRHLGEEGLLALARKVPLGVEPQRPPALTPDVAQHILQGVDGDLAARVGRAVGEPGLDAAVVVGGGLENDRKAGGVLDCVFGPAAGSSSS